MTPDPQRSPDSLPLSRAWHVDRVCDRFEDAWKKGGRPRIEDYLGDTPEPERSELLRELVRLDVNYRGLAGENPQPEDYRARFPALDTAQLRNSFASQAEPNGAPALVRLATNCPERTGPYQEGVEALPLGSALTDCPKQIGRYRVEKILGEGGFGRVYLAHDNQLNRPVAIKVTHRKLVARPEDAEAFLIEARTVANLDHSNIVHRPTHLFFLIRY